MLDIVTIEVSEEFLQPLVHDLVVCPSMIELREEDGSSLSRFVAKSWKDIRRQVALDRVPVSLIEFARPVVR